MSWDKLSLCSSTLKLCFRYANRAKNIKNKPKINEDPKDALLREFQEEIARLKEALINKGGPKEKKKKKKKKKKVMREIYGKESIWISWSLCFVLLSDV